jgi:hypothetical protein
VQHRLVCLTALGALFLAGCAAHEPGTSAAQETDYTLVLLAGACHLVDQDRVACQGSVVNRSGPPLDNVLVSVTWLDAQGAAWRTDIASVAANPLLPAWPAAWSVSGRYMPGLRRFRIAFAQFGGPDLPTRDDRDNPQDLLQ